MSTQAKAENRDDLLDTRDLYGFLCEKTAEEFMAMWEKSHTQPPVGGLIFTLIISVVMFSLQMTTPGIFFGIITVLQGIWVGYGFISKSMGKAEEKKNAILMGHIPDELAPLVISRLKWWTHLIVPQNWAKHSRIHTHKKLLTDKLKQVSLSIESMKMENEETENPEEKRELPFRDLTEQEVNEFAEMINTSRQRDHYQEEIDNSEDEAEKLMAQLLLYSAISIKVNRFTEKLDRIETLKPNIDPLAFSNLGEMAKVCCIMLEEKRSLVRETDRVKPDEFLEITRI